MSLLDTEMNEWILFFFFIVCAASFVPKLNKLCKSTRSPTLFDIYCLWCSTVSVSTTATLINTQFNSVVRSIQVDKSNLNELGIRDGQLVFSDSLLTRYFFAFVYLFGCLLLYLESKGRNNDTFIK